MTAVKKECFKCPMNIEQNQGEEKDVAEPRLLIKISGVILRLNYNDIYYFRAEGHYIRVISKKGSFKYRKSINELELELKASAFIRTHRGYIVNLQYATVINRYSLLLENGEEIPISRAKRKTTKSAFYNYYAWGEV